MKRLKTFSFILWLVFVCPVAPAQFNPYAITYRSSNNNRLLDSLRKELARAKMDTTRMWLMNQLSHIHYSQSFDSAKWYAEQSIKLAQRIGHQKGELQGRLFLGDVYSLRDIPKSMRLYLEALHLAQQTNRRVEISYCFQSLGVLSIYLRNYRQAITYFTQCHALALSLFDKQQASVSSFEIGGAYFWLHQPDSSRYYVVRSAQEYPPSRLNPVWLFYRGRLEIGHNAVQAARYLRQSVQIAQQQQDSRVLSLAYRWYADFLWKHNQADSSLLVAKKALQIGQRIANYPIVEYEGESLAHAYQALGRSDSAYKYQRLMVAARDSLVSYTKIYQLQNTLVEEQQRLESLKEEKSRFENNVKVYSLLSVVFLVLSVAGVLYRNNRQKQQTNRQLQGLNQSIGEQKEKIETQRDHLEQTLTELQTTQAQLIQKEKLASLGELTAGIAHEIQNPLNFVNNFSEVSKELIDEQKEALAKGDTEEAIAIADDLSQNLQKIHHHGGRASSIVKGMLEHSRTDSGEKRPTDLNALANEYLHIAFHGLKAKDKSFDCQLVTHFDASAGQVVVSPKEIGRVLLNLYNNAFYAVNERAHQSQANTYKPTVEVSTKHQANQIIIQVRDNGTGIAESVQAKIFQPFFTTKPTGEGTGLGLSLSYDIITKGHGGSLTVASKAGEGTEFVIEFPALS